MKLRIVTATRGESPYWSEAAASVAAAAPGAEHVVVCPADRMTEVGGVAGRFALVPQQQPGLYPNLNQGLRVPGDWEAYTWINDDDRLCGPGFGALLAAMERDPAIDIAFGRVDLIDGRGAYVGALPIVRQAADLAGLFVRGIIPFAQPGTVMRRELYERLHGFDESYRIVGDMDLFVRAAAAGARFAFVDAPVASFRLNAGQLSKRQAEVAAETARALQPLAGTRPRPGAVVRFRLANWRIYLERLRRHGWVSMRELYDRTT
jgi:hypothetical protein